jgi:MFS family permease
LGGVIEARVYRAAFIPALLAVVLAMFSFQSRPGPLQQGLAADVLFDGREAARLAARIATDQPDRRAGEPGDAATADFVADSRDSLEARGFQVERQRFSYAGRSLENVIGRRAGSSRRQIVIVAARDAPGVPDGPGSASDTAALLELARVFEGRPSRKTLVLASVDGSYLGEVGTERLLSELGSPSFVDAVIVMSSIGSNAEKPSVQAWSNDSRRVGIGLERTVEESIREELQSTAGGNGLVGQLSRLAFPLGIGPQGVLLADGYDSVRISGSGELPEPGDGPVDAIDEDRLGALGRATLRTVTALDQGRRPGHGPDSYLLAVSQVLPGWVISLLAGALLLPVLVASVDAFARARRRQIDVLRWLRFVGAWVAPFLAALALAELLALVGATPTPPSAPVPPDVLPLDGPALGVLGGLAAVMVLAFLLARWLAARPDPQLKQPGEPGAAVAVALGLSLGCMLLWALNPWAGLLAVPAAHLWMLAVLTRPLPPRRGRMVMVALGLVLPLLVALYYLFALSIDPLSAAWYLVMLLTGHSVGFAMALVGCLLLGVACAVVEVAWRTPEEEQSSPEERPSVFGPGAYAGPGSLGGTSSALDR